jgi:hypothetical protein
VNSPGIHERSPQSGLDSFPKASVAVILGAGGGIGNAFELAAVVNRLSVDSSGGFFDYLGEPIPW